MKYFLGIESSCDETAAAVVTGDLKILSNVVSSQIPIHAKYGGVVPEIASRNHITTIAPVVAEALAVAGIEPSQITAVAATTQPGLPGAVLVGRVFGESLATALGVPFYPVNHIHGHIASTMFDGCEGNMSLVISGGHTSLYNVDKSGVITVAEATLDDAIGEAFDKVARILGLPYPGGPEIEKLATGFNGELIQFVAKPNYAMQGFSYSGIKTAVLNYVNRLKQKNQPVDIAQVAASFQREAIAQLVYKCLRALRKAGAKTLCISGGVSINKVVRETLTTECAALGVEVRFPPVELCGDNAAMIAGAAIMGLRGN